MNFTIDREILLDSLNVVLHGLPNKTPMKVLEGIKMELTNEDLYLTSTNSDISIQILVKDSSLEIKQQGKTIVPGKVFINLIKAFDSKKITLFLLEDKALMIKADRKEYIINVMDPSDYPTIDFVALENPFNVDFSILKKAIDQTTFACASINSPTRNPMLLGVNLKLAANQLIMTATNSYRLSQKTIVIPENYNDFEITIPAKSLEDLKKALDVKGLTDSIEIYLDRNRVLFKHSNILFQTRLLDGQFPNTSNIIPKETPFIVRFNKDELLTAVNRIALLSDTEKESELNYSSITLKIDNSSDVELSSSNIQGNGKEIIVPTSLTANDYLCIAFSAKYLVEALRVIEDNEVDVCFINNIRQFTISSASDKSLIEVVLPFRL